MLDHGAQNRGVNAIIKRYARLWPRLGCPIIVQLADRELHFLRAVVERLAAIESISGFELVVPPLVDGQRTTEEWLEQALYIVTQNSDLPVWVKLPLHSTRSLAKVAVTAGAAALVIGQAPTGALPPTNLAATASSTLMMSAPIRGQLYGPGTFPQMVAALIEVTALALPVALIACGGIHTLAQAQQVLALGADAFQLDSAVWIEPGLPQRLCQALARHVA
ncbi:MAG: hypothetical protein R2932_03330 [Caldilineaceae bacterium]